MANVRLGGDSVTLDGDAVTLGGAELSAEEKNKISTASAWLILLDIVLTDNSHFYLVRNNEDVIYKGLTYTQTNFNIEGSTQNSKGEVPNIKLSVANVSRTLQPYLEATNGGVGSTVKISVVNSTYLADGVAELESDFTVLSTSSNAYFVVFSLGMPNPLNKRFPLYRCIADNCKWQFKGAECNYSGADSACDRTLKACRLKGNSRRYGGAKGLSGGGIRLVF